MLIKKVLSIDRKTGKLLSERFGGPVDMSEERFFQPMVELYREDMDRLAEEMRKGKQNEVST